MSKVKARGGRAQAAELGRDAIASAARRLFRERGYAESTMESIAAESGYAVQTIYFHFKSKAAILSRLLDALQEEQIAPRYELSMASTDPAEVIRLIVGIAHDTYDHGWDLMQALGAAAKRDQSSAARLDDWESGRLFGSTSLVRRLVELNALRGGLEESSAISLSWALASPELYRLLRVERGWDRDAYQEWLARALIGELLGDSTPGSAESIQALDLPAGDN